MEILNVGPLEIIIILALMFIFLGPKDMVKTAQGIGRWVRGITTSPMWREVWGISQDIRELPKKLMEDTGLEEALTDVKQTTQEVANEFNAQIKEAKEAARIPEVEHLRIETNPTIAPPAGSVSAALGARVETNAAAEQPPALVQVAEEATAPVVRKPRRKKLPAEAAPAAAAAGDVLDAPVKMKKPRRKKSDAPVEAVGTEPENAEMAAATEPEAALLVVDQPLAEEPAAPEKARKPRRKKLETAAAEPAVAADAAVAEESGIPQAEAPAVPEKIRKPRRKKLETTAAEPAFAEESGAPLAAEPVEMAGPAPVKRSRRKKLETPENTPVEAALDEMPSPSAAVEVVELPASENVVTAVETTEAESAEVGLSTRESTEVEAAALETSAADSTVTAAAPEPAAPKKPRRKKQIPPPLALEDQSPPSTPILIMETAAEQTEGLAPQVLPETAPVESMDSAVAELVDSTTLPVKPRRRARALKSEAPASQEAPAVPQTAETQVGTPHGSDDALVETPTQPRQRKPRVRRSGAALPAPSGNGAQHENAPVDAAGQADAAAASGEPSHGNGNGSQPARTRKKRQAEQTPHAEHVAAEPAEQPDRDAA